MARHLIVTHTNALCPDCNRNLVPGETVAFFCQKCHKGYLINDVKKVAGELFEITIPLTEKEFITVHSQLYNLTEQAHCNFFGYDNLAKVCDIGFTSKPQDIRGFVGKIEKINA